MNKNKIVQLLNDWSKLLEIGIDIAKSKAANGHGGLNGRIRRTTGCPVIFDFNTYSKQQKIQKSLCDELPNFEKLINSVPEIMDGYAWQCGDFIELYFNHYKIVVLKIKKAINL